MTEILEYVKAYSRSRGRRRQNYTCITISRHFLSPANKGMIFLLLNKIICYDPSSVPSQQDASNDGTRIGKPALEFYESLKNIFSSKTNAVKHTNS